MEKSPLGKIQKFLENFLRNFWVILQEFIQYVDFKRLQRLQF